MPFNPQDHYFKQAKKDGYLARSAYKLLEVQKKFKIIKQGDKVLDLGCAPGSWSQVALELIGGKGLLEGFDLKPITLEAPNARFFVRDVFELKPEELNGFPYDVVISDMAPNTTGIVFTDQARSEQLCIKVLEVCQDMLKPNGNMVMKFFQGGGAKELEMQVRKQFKTVKHLKPLSTRKESKEIFIVGIGKK